MRRTAELFNRKTGGLKNVGNVDSAESGFYKVDEGLTGPYHIAVPKRRADAWVPDNNQDPQELRGLLWSEYSLSIAKYAREEGFCKKRVEYE
jgi:hypothetical protein